MSDDATELSDFLFTWLRGFMSKICCAVEQTAVLMQPLCVLSKWFACDFIQFAHNAHI